MASLRTPAKGQAPRLPVAGLGFVLLGAVLLCPPGRAQSQAELQGYQQRLQRLFERLDRNGDGRLEPAEVEGQAYLQKHFTRLDQQQRGYLTPTDLHSPATANHERLRQFFRQADANGDGKISRQEAAAYPWLERRFGEADRDANSSLTREELRQLRRTTPRSPAAVR